MHLWVRLSEALLMVIKTLLLRLIGATHIHHNGRLEVTDVIPFWENLWEQENTSSMNANWNAIFTSLYLLVVSCIFGWIESIFQISLNNQILALTSQEMLQPIICHRVRLVDFLCLSCSQNRETLKFIKTSRHPSDFDEIILGVHPTKKMEKIEHDAVFQESASSSDPF